MNKQAKALMERLFAATKEHKLPFRTRGFRNKDVAILALEREGVAQRVTTNEGEQGQTGWGLTESGNRLYKKWVAEGNHSAVSPLKSAQAKRLQLIVELRRNGMTLKEIQDHPGIGPISTEGIRQLLRKADRREEVEREIRLHPSHSMEPTKPTLASTVEELGLSTRALNALRYWNIVDIEELVATPDCVLLHIKNLGKNTLAEIRGRLAVHGFTPKE